MEELRSCGLSGRKAEYIIDFSQAVARNEFDPESLKNCEHEEIVEKLTQIRGLGAKQVFSGKHLHASNAMRLI